MAKCLKFLVVPGESGEDETYVDEFPLNLSEDVTPRGFTFADVTISDGKKQLKNR